MPRAPFSGWHNRKAREQADEDIGDATVGEFRAFVTRTRKDPRVDGIETIFRNEIKPNGNFDCDFQLHRALSRGCAG